MEHFDIFLVTSSSDLADAEAAGYLNEYDIPYCEACREDVGYQNGELYSFVVIIDKSDRDLWLACEACYTPVIYP
jgi:hypothetical protein